METEKQRQRRRDDTRLTESRDARSEQLLVMPTESLSSREWLPGEHWRPGWFLDMKYLTLSQFFIRIWELGDEANGERRVRKTVGIITG